MTPRGSPAKRARPGSPSVKNRGAIINVRRPEQRFSVVPDALITDRSLTTDARVVLIYLAGRPDDWMPMVGDICGSLGISDYKWRGVRASLKEAGILTHQMRSLGRACLEWDFEVDLTRYY